jgi:hypothetical protein
MVKLTVSRKARFESALKLVGLTQTSWAEASGRPEDSSQRIPERKTSLGATYREDRRFHSEGRSG